MTDARPDRLDRPVDPVRDRILGSPDAEITLVEYGGYTCRFCHAAHAIIASLRDRFGDRMRYVFRHRPLRDGPEGREAAALAEYAAGATGRFWEAHDTLMQRGPVYGPGELGDIARELGLKPDHDSAEWQAAAARVEDDFRSAGRSGALGTPTFFINGRRYEGPWDESALAEVMLGSLGHRLHTASLNFARWAPSTGLLLLVMTVLAIALTNSEFGPAFAALWAAPLAISLGGHEFALPLVGWINDGLLSLFFLVVGLEIKREFTIGRLATRRAAALPIAASFGGMVVPALIYLALIPSGPLAAGWGMTIATDTAFAIALIAVLGDRVPVDLRVFLTAAVIVDDLVAIGVIALFYTGSIDGGYLVAAAVVTAGLVALNRWNIYRPLPYAVLGIVLWLCLHEAGIHATLAGVILALTTPTRPPPNLYALMGQAQMVVEAEAEATAAGGPVMRHGLSEPTLRAMDVIHDRIEAPAAKLLRSVEPWSSYVVLPLFAFANAGVVLSFDIVAEHGRLVLAIVLGLVLGKLLGILGAGWLAVRAGVAVKPATYTWRQVAGAGALAGIGFTMSLFIAGHAFSDAADFAAAKIAIFLASFVAGGLGVLILWRRKPA